MIAPGTAASIRIGARVIGPGRPAYVIAEAGSNHNGDVGVAKELVDAATAMGCDCIKFQTYTAENFVADRNKQFTYRSQGRDVTESEFDMFKRLEFDRDEWADLMAHCVKRGIQFLTTVQDPANLEMMLTLGLQGIKVGSDDFDHLANLRVYAAAGLPLIVSKGMADLPETDRVLRELRELARGRLAVLHCVSLYPADPAHLNIRQLGTLQMLYPDVVWGFSDHSRGTLASCIAVALGASIVEKHFTLSHDLPGPDHWFSMDVPAMKQLVRDIRFTESAMGSGEVSPSAKELESRPTMRRRVVAAANLPSGTILDERSATFMRATDGIFLDQWDLIRDKRLAVPKRRHEGIAMKDIDFSG